MNENIVAYGEANWSPEELRYRIRYWRPYEEFKFISTEDSWIAALFCHNGTQPALYLSGVRINLRYDSKLPAVLKRIFAGDQ